VAGRGEDYFKQAEIIREAKKRLNELERMDPNDRDTMLEQLKNWRKKAKNELEEEEADPTQPESMTEQIGMPTDQASKFRDTEILEESVQQAINERQRDIDAAFTDKPRGERCTIRATFAKSIGVGFMLNARNEVIPTPSMMKSIEIHLVLVDEVEGLFVVETAYPK